MAIVLFITKLIASSGILFGYYFLFLRNKRFHRYNRFYLLSVTLFSCIIPFIDIPVNLFQNNRQHTGLIHTLTVITAGGWEEPVTIYARRNLWSNWITLQNGLYFVYMAGVVTGLVILMRSVAYIRALKKRYPCETIEQLTIYNTIEPGTPFSFFRSIFWNNKISLNSKTGQQIFRHEMFHVKQLHSADTLLMEMICCIGWFNPVFQLIKKELKAIHEFLADEYAAPDHNRHDYAELLVLHAINQKTPAITHPFFHNQIKRRITMITQSNLVRRSGYFSRIMILPLLLILVSAFAVRFTQPPPMHASSHYAGRTITAVIDAGHGGKYAGSNGNGLSEKNITLGIAQKIKELSKEYNIKIVMTRNNDALVGNATDLQEDLHNRVDISNNAKADIFVSIHINATAENTTSLSGFDAYISGKNEHPKDRQLATTLLNSLKDIYSVNDTIQQREVGITVLDKNTCPSVCIECGYITNAKDAAFISNAANQEKVARKILEGIVQYGNAQAENSSAFSQLAAGKMTNDTISPEELSHISQDDIKSVVIDEKKDYALFTLKNGDTKPVNLKSLKDYYSANPPTHHDINFTVKQNGVDSVYDVAINNIDTVPASKEEQWNKTFTKVEIEPDYPGGGPGWRNYLLKHLQYPPAALKKNLQGTIVVQFIVDQQGKISDVKAISGPELLRAESIKVIKESGNWISAMQNGKKVKAYKRQPITYKLS